MWLSLDHHENYGKITFSTSFLTMDGHMMRIFSVLFYPNDNHVFLSGGWDDTMQVRINNHMKIYMK